MVRIKKEKLIGDNHYSIYIENQKGIAGNGKVAYILDDIYYSLENIEMDSLSKIINAYKSYRDAEDFTSFCDTLGSPIKPKNIKE